MNEVITYFLKTISSSTQSLKKKGILIGKPWALIDSDGKVQKLIFKRDRGLILSKNGVVTEGSWDYYPEAHSLLIDRVTDKVLLKEQYIDDKVLVLKKDETDNDFFAFANENTLPDYDIPKYLYSLKCKQLSISVNTLFNGNKIEIYTDQSNYPRLKVGLLDSNYISSEPEDGKYLNFNRERTYYIKNGILEKTTWNRLVTLKNGESIEVENDDESHYVLKNKPVTINGTPVIKGRLETNENRILEVQDGIILNIKFIKSYQLKNGWEVKIQQNSDYDLFKKGDRIISCSGEWPMPDGKYKVKEYFNRLRVENLSVVK